MVTIDLSQLFGDQNPDDNASKRTMVYTTDHGKKIPVLITENYGEVLGFEDFPATGIPAGERAPDYLRFEMRKIHCSSASGKVKRSFPVGKPDEEIYVSGGQVIVPRLGTSQGVTLLVTGSTGESKTFPQSGDTGQIGGDDNMGGQPDD